MVSFLTHEKKQKMLYLKHFGFWFYTTQIWVMFHLWGKIENCNSQASTPEWQLLELWVCLLINWGLLHKEFYNFISHMVRILFQNYSSLVKTYLCFQIYYVSNVNFLSLYLCLLCTCWEQCNAFSSPVFC